MLASHLIMEFHSVLGYQRQWTAHRVDVNVDHGPAAHVEFRAAKCRICTLPALCRWSSDGNGELSSWFAGDFCPPPRHRPDNMIPSISVASRVFWTPAHLAVTWPWNGTVRGIVLTEHCWSHILDAAVVRMILMMASPSPPTDNI